MLHILRTFLIQNFNCVNACKNNNDCLGISVLKSQRTSACVEYRGRGVGAWAITGGADIENLVSNGSTVFKRVRVEY